jgi:hypothetical protein
MINWVAVDSEALARMADEFDKLRDDGLISVQRHSQFSKVIEDLNITRIQSPDSIASLVVDSMASMELLKGLYSKRPKIDQHGVNEIISKVQRLQDSLAPFTVADTASTRKGGA